MATHKYKAAGLVSMTQAAEIVGIAQSTFWAYVNGHRLIPSPKTQVGKRSYYDADQLAEVKATVKELQKRGII